MTQLELFNYCTDPEPSLSYLLEASSHIHKKIEKKKSAMGRIHASIKYDSVALKYLEKKIEDMRKVKFASC